MGIQAGITAEEVDARLQEKAALSTTPAENKDQKSDDEAKKDDPKADDKGEKDKTGEDGAKDKDKDADPEVDENTPFHKHPRFVQLLNEAHEGREAKAKLEEVTAKLAEIESRQKEQEAQAKKEYKLDPNMPFDEAMAKIKQDAAREALELLKAEQAKASETDAIVAQKEKLIQDGFSLLRESGLKITEKDEDAIAGVAVKYGMNLQTPADMLKAYEIFDLQRKTSGTGRAKEDSAPGKDRNSKNEKSDPINHRATSWSDLSNIVAARLGVQSERF